MRSARDSGAYGGVVSLVLLLLFSVVLSGCGYSIHGRQQLPVRSLAIGEIRNKTFEPKLDDGLRRALAGEFLRQGIRLDQASPDRVEGSIKNFTLRTLSEKGGVAVQYELVITGDFSLIGTEGKARPLRGNGAFFISFLSGGHLEDVMARKDVAITKALDELAAEIVAAVIYE